MPRPCRYCAGDLPAGLDPRARYCSDACRKARTAARVRAYYQAHRGERIASEVSRQRARRHTRLRREYSRTVPSQRRRILRLLGQGWIQERVARATGLSQATVSRVKTQAEREAAHSAA